MKKIRNIIRYIIIFIMNLLMLLFLHSYFNMVILILLLVLPAVSIISAAVAIRNIDIAIEGTNEKLNINEPFLLRVRVTNKSFIPVLNVFMNVDVENDFFMSAGTHVLNIPAFIKGVNEVEYRLSSEYIGIIKVSIPDMVIMDWFGFVRLKKKVGVSKEYTILPDTAIQVMPDNTAISAGMTEAEESHKKGNDFAEVSDIREYIPGDKLQNIHWKLSAKENNIMVKERVSLSSDELMVLVELTNDVDMILNDILCAMYGMADYMIRQNVPFSIYWWSVGDQDMKRTVIDGMADLEETMENIFYERYYADAKLGTTIMKRLMNEGSRFMVIGRRDAGNGVTVFTYKDTVEGCICE